MKFNSKIKKIKEADSEKVGYLLLLAAFRFPPFFLGAARFLPPFLAAARLFLFAAAALAVAFLFAAFLFLVCAAFLAAALHLALDVAINFPPCYCALCGRSHDFLFNYSVFLT